MFRTTSSGHSYTEYAFILGIVLVVCLVSLSGMGGSISTLLTGKVGGALTPEGEASGVMGILKPVKSLPAKIDPVSGLPIVRFSDYGGSSTNATSVPGQYLNEVGTMLLAKSMKQIADTEEDPDRAAAYRLAADKIYLMGAAQGAAKGVPALKIAPRYIPGQKGSSGFLGLFGKKKAVPSQNINYTSRDAVNDVARFQAEINGIMSSIPADLTDADYVTAMALVQDATSIGQKFAEDPANSNAAATGRRVDDPDALADVNQVKTKAEAVLTDNKVEDINVEVTFTDAKMTEQIANKRRRVQDAASEIGRDVKQSLKKIF